MPIYIDTHISGYLRSWRKIITRRLFLPPLRHRRVTLSASSDPERAIGAASFPPYPIIIIIITVVILPTQWERIGQPPFAGEWYKEMMNHADCWGGKFIHKVLLERGELILRKQEMRWQGYQHSLTSRHSFSSTGEIGNVRKIKICMTSLSLSVQLTVAIQVLPYNT